MNGADEITVQLSDGREFTATEVKADDRADLAIIRIEVKEKTAVAFLLGMSRNWKLATGFSHSAAHLDFIARSHRESSVQSPEDSMTPA